jgi:dihydrofolate reductase
LSLQHGTAATWRRDAGRVGASGDLATAVATAVDAADGRNVVLFGASIPQQCLRDGLLDEIVIHLAPVLLGDGVRLFDAPGGAPVVLRRTVVAGPGRPPTCGFACGNRLRRR